MRFQRMFAGKRRSGSSDSHTNDALPTMWSSGTKPRKARESAEFVAVVAHHPVVVDEEGMTYIWKMKMWTSVATTVAKITALTHLVRGFVVLLRSQSAFVAAAYVAVEQFRDIEVVDDRKSQQQPEVARPHDEPERKGSRPARNLPICCERTV